MSMSTSTESIDETRQTSISLYLGCGLLMAVILVADLAIPLGVAMGVPYVAAVLLSLWSPQKRFTVLVAAICTVLTIVGLFYSPQGGELWQAISNRFLALFAIWVTAVLSLQRKLIDEKRQKALQEIKILRGFLPICASCKKIRDDSGYWNQMEAYIRDHSEAEFSHGICPECAKKLYPEFYENEPR
jgi:hypothetical protein